MNIFFNYFFFEKRLNSDMKVFDLKMLQFNLRFFWNNIESFLYIILV